MYLLSGGHEERKRAINMKIVVLIAILVTGIETQAANVFEVVIGGPDLDRGIYVSPTRDGGFILVGSTKSYGEGEEDIYLVKTDSQGEVHWSRTLGGPEADFGWAVHEVTDGFILAGFTQSFGKGDFDFYLVKTDSEGNGQWSNTYGGTGSDRCWTLAVADDGGYVLAGETTSSGAGEEDFFLVKTDSLGAEQWSQTYGGKKGDRCFSIALADDGGYVLAGQTYSVGAGDRDAHVVKTKASGEKEWSREFGGPASDVAHSVIKTNDGHFLVTGYTTSLAANGDDPYLIKIDAQGKTDWTSVPSLKGINHTLTGDQAVDGGFYLVGFSVSQNTGTKVALLVKTDAQGSLEWHRDIMSIKHEESFGYTVRATVDGGCVFTGHTTVNSAGHLDVLLVGVEGGSADGE